MRAALAAHFVFNPAAQRLVFNRIGRPVDIPDIVAFVASDDARWIAGQYLDATGGTGL
ncbi:hypothetical protein [Streptomyces litmocidini]|uniref:hypothetical protein n=1 Tax=Streptomyces litmocidini TaxID=67318 RepID=UPI0036F5B93A